MNFFLDCFGADPLKLIISELSAATTAGVNWLIAITIRRPDSERSLFAQTGSKLNFRELSPLTRQRCGEQVVGESLETTKIHSIVGLLSPGPALVTRRPFRTPHHTASDAGLLGGNINPTPGEISLAHHGVLFLDELTEFKRSVLETMRQPLEESRVTISRAAGTVTFPSEFMLVAAMNPSPDRKMPGESRSTPRESGSEGSIYAFELFGLRNFETDYQLCLFERFCKALDKSDLH
jgi:hypothetical protein